MFERTPNLDVSYVPADLDPDDAVRLGAAWLQDQPGSGLVLLHAKKMYDNNRLLPQSTGFAEVASPTTWHRTSWRGGPILAPWPSEKVLAALSDQLSHKLTSVCIVKWDPDDSTVNAWLAAHSAINLMTGDPETDGAAEEQLDPVVVVAMKQMSAMINHNNGLVQSYEKSFAVRTLQELHRAGYSYQVDDLVAWAMANGFTGTEAKYLREYATKVQAGRGFRLRETVGPRAGAIKRWQEEAAEL